MRKVSGVPDPNVGKKKMEHCHQPWLLVADEAAIVAYSIQGSETALHTHCDLFKGARYFYKTVSAKFSIRNHKVGELQP